MNGIYGEVTDLGELKEAIDTAAKVIFNDGQPVTLNADTTITLLRAACWCYDQKEKAGE